MPSVRRSSLLLPLLLCGLFSSGGSRTSFAQTASPATPAANTTTSKALGTVKSVDPGTITLQTAAGAAVSVSVGPETKVVQLAPGSTDIKSGQAATLSDVAPGDRVLATGPVAGGAGTAGTGFAASRLILMKSGAIAARNASAEADWRRRGTGGLVRSVEGSVITVSAGTRTILVQTTPATVFRRYTAGSVKFADAQPGTLAEIKPGDQVRVRGERSSADRGGSTPASSGSSPTTTVAAEEIVSGSFRNLSGVVTAVDTAAGTVTLRDTATKAPVTVSVTASSDLRRLTPEAAATFAARRERAGGEPGAAGRPAPVGTSGSSGSSGANAAAGASRPRDAGADLSTMMARLPAEMLADLHAGDTVLLVASGGDSGTWTTITLLSGAESLLSAPGSSGGRPVTLSPWNLGAPEGGQ